MSLLKGKFLVNSQFSKPTSRLLSTVAQRVFASQVVQNLEDKFKLANLPDPQSSARHLVAAILHQTNLERFSKISTMLEMNDIQITKVMKWADCRLARMPVQYIIGNWQFLNLTLKIRPPVFIPRPETEQLVLLVVDHLKKGQADDSSYENVGIVDICCGSGAVGLALVEMLPGLSITCVDQSNMACQLTLENAVALELDSRVNVQRAKLTSESVSNREFLKEIKPSSLDIVVSNPPYIPRKDLRHLQPEIALYEDLRAVDGGAEGLCVIEPLLQWANEVLKVGGHVFLEVDPCHPYLLPRVLETFNKRIQSFGLVHHQTIKDFAEKDRFLVLNKIH